MQLRRTVVENGIISDQSTPMGVVVTISVIVLFAAGIGWLIYYGETVSGPAAKRAREEYMVNYGTESVMRVCVDGTRVVKYPNGEYWVFNFAQGWNRAAGPDVCAGVESR